MDDKQLIQVVGDYSNAYEKSIKSQIDFLRGANTMIAWIVTLSGATLIFGFSEMWGNHPNSLALGLTIQALQILCAVFHRIYNDSHISALNHRIDYVNLQKCFLQNDLKSVRGYPDDKIFFDVYNRMGKLDYLNDIEMSGLADHDVRLKITRRIFSICGLLVILTFLALYCLLISLLIG